VFLSSILQRGTDAVLPIVNSITRRGERAVFLTRSKGGTFEVRDYPAEGRLAIKYHNDTSGDIIVVGVYDEDVVPTVLYEDIVAATPVEIARSYHA
jgi:hypothetical protein